MKVFLTGGTGFLGGWVLKDLLAEGFAVRALTRGGKLPEGAEAVAIGLDDPGLADAIAGTDAVIHLAGKVSRDPKDASEMHYVHVELTKRLLDAMTKAKVKRLVLASTSGTIAVHEMRGHDATELDSPDLAIIGRWPYYMSKRFQEAEVLSRCSSGELEAVVLNPSLLLGPGDERLSSTADVWKILHGRIPTTTKGTMAVVDVRDCAPIFRRAISRGASGQRYLLNGANLDVRSFCERVAHAGGVSAPKLRVPDRWAVLGAKVMEGLYQATDRIPPIDAVSVDMSRYHWSCSSAKAEAELGFSPRDPRETILDTVRYLEQRGLYRRANRIPRS